MFHPTYPNLEVDPPPKTMWPESVLANKLDITLHIIYAHPTQSDVALQRAWPPTQDLTQHKLRIMQFYFEWLQPNTIRLTLTNLDVSLSRSPTYTCVDIYVCTSEVGKSEFGFRLTWVQLVSSQFTWLHMSFSDLTLVHVSWGDLTWVQVAYEISAEFK
jgi:hypothetical protein